MNGLLSTEEITAAAVMGWTLDHVYDLKLKRWLVLVMPITFGASPHFSADEAGAFVVNLARRGHALSIKALRLVMSSHTPEKKGKR